MVMLIALLFSFSSPLSAQAPAFERALPVIASTADSLTVEWFKGSSAFRFSGPRYINRRSFLEQLEEAIPDTHPRNATVALPPSAEAAERGEALECPHGPGYCNGVINEGLYIEIKDLVWSDGRLTAVVESVITHRRRGIDATGGAEWEFTLIPDGNSWMMESVRLLRRS